MDKEYKEKIRDLLDSFDKEVEIAGDYQDLTKYQWSNFANKARYLLIELLIAENSLKLAQAYEQVFGEK